MSMAESILWPSGLRLTDESGLMLLLYEFEPEKRVNVKLGFEVFEVWPLFKDNANLNEGLACNLFSSVIELGSKVSSLTDLRDICNLCEDSLFEALLAVLDSPLGGGRNPSRILTNPLELDLAVLKGNSELEQGGRH